MKSYQKAFTTMEFIVVLAAIGLLTLVILSVSGRVIRDSKISTATRDMEVIASAVLKAKDELGSYPGSGTNIAPSVVASSQLNSNAIIKYLNQRIANDPWGRAYRYRVRQQAGSNNQYAILYSWGPDRSEGLQASPACNDASIHNRAATTCLGDDILIYIE